MNVNERLAKALKRLKCEVCREPAMASTDVHVSWFGVLASTALDASNHAHVISQMIQVDVYSRPPADDLVDDVLEALRLGGFRIVSWGPEDYEVDTGYHHVPITVRWNERIEEG